MIPVILTFMTKCLAAIPCFLGLSYSTFTTLCFTNAVCMHVHVSMCACMGVCVWFDYSLGLVASTTLSLR